MSDLVDKLGKVAHEMQDFEASASVSNTGTGERREGDQFETLVMKFWSYYADSFETEDKYLVELGSHRWLRIGKHDRAVYLPTVATTGYLATTKGKRWLTTKYFVSDLVSLFPGEPHAIAAFSPSTGPYAGADYPGMYSGLSTNFDGTILLEKGGVLIEKILLEYKTGKSSKGTQIDGNAHERLSFQIMQYLEVATKYPKCSMYVITNGAFAKYRNKYHVSFNVQSERLKVYSWFELEYLTHATEYFTLLDKITGFLNGVDG